MQLLGKQLPVFNGDSMKTLYGLIFALVLSISTAFSADFPLGTYGGHAYSYITESVHRTDSLTTVLVISRDEYFNKNKDSSFALMGEVLVIDCTEGQVAVLELIIVNKKAELVTDIVIPKEKIKFLPIMYHTVQAGAYRALCVPHTAI